MSTKCLPQPKRKVLNVKPSFKCGTCKKLFKKFTIFEGHFAFNVMCRAKSGWFIQCFVCGQKFRYLAELKYHIRLHPIEKRGQLQPQRDCKINNPAVDNENGISRVHEISHADGFPCNICQRNCRTKFYLNEHLLSHSKEAPTKKPETVNGQHVETVDQLPSSSTAESENRQVDNSDKMETEEQSTTHADGLKCQSCDYPFTTEISLEFHRKLFHQVGASDEPKKNSLQCEICQAKFTYSGNLKRHQFVHTIGEEVCKICHIKFTKKSLEVHVKEAHQELLDDSPVVDVSKVKQPNDEITTPSIAPHSIAAPIEAYTPIPSDNITPPNASERSEIITPPIASQVSYSCGQCGKSVTSIHHLRMHVKSHHRVPCSICGKTFGSGAGLSNHFRSHRFQCYICKKFSSSAQRLGVHIAKHQVFEQWIDPVNVYLSNWNPEESQEILQNQPLVMVERLNVNNLTHSVNEIGLRKKIKDEAQIGENITDVPAIVNGESDEVQHQNGESDEVQQQDGEPEASNQTSVQEKRSEKFDNSAEILVVKAKIEQTNGIDTHRTLSFDDDGIVIVEQQPDTTTDDDNVIDVSSESDIDEMELYHCYFCNETFRSLHCLGIHIKKCSFCP